MLPPNSTFQAPRRTALLASFFAIVALVGCGGIGLDAASSYGGTGGDDARTLAPPPSGAVDAGAAASDATPGAIANPGRDTSPLCSWKGNSCFPDTSSSCSQEDAGTKSGGELADAAAADAAAVDLDAKPAPDGATPGFGCHVANRIDGTRGPVCGAAGSDEDGRSCFTGESCASGSECVSAAGECRRYCCDMTACDSQHFCDIQPMHDAKSSFNVPVCMPIRTSCKLLGADCTERETCAVVNETTAETSCISIGPRHSDEECETDHCASNLTCLGSAGSRKCHRLCFIGKASDCNVDEECRGNSTTFKGQDRVGVCAKTAP